MAQKRDPEVVELTAAINRLLGQAYALSRQLVETVSELEEYADDVARARHNEKKEPGNAPE